MKVLESTIYGVLGVDINDDPVAINVAYIDIDDDNAQIVAAIVFIDAEARDKAFETIDVRECEYAISVAKPRASAVGGLASNIIASTNILH